VLISNRRSWRQHRTGHDCGEFHLASDLTDIASITQRYPGLTTAKPCAAARHVSELDHCPSRGNPRRSLRPRQCEKIASVATEISSQSAIEDGALGFMAKVLVQTTLPHRAVSGTRYVRTDGNLSLSINDVGGTGIPYGSYPRLILIWMTTEAVRTKRRELALGRSLSCFMAQLGLHATGGHWGTISQFRNQMERLLGCAISTRWSSQTNSEFHSGGDNLLLADDFNLWWAPLRLACAIPKMSAVTLSEKFFEQISEAPVPLDLRAVRALKKSPLTLDIYAWATRRVSYLSRPTLIPWPALRRSFGAGYADTPQGHSRFRQKATEAFGRVSAVYPQLRAEVGQSGVYLRPCVTHIPRALP
jgi:Plasmid encoded RepA protein